MKKKMQIIWSGSNKGESKNRMKKIRGINYRKIERAVRIKFLEYEDMTDFIGKGGVLLKEVNRVKVKPDNDKETAPPPRN